MKKTMFIVFMVASNNLFCMDLNRPLSNDELQQASDHAKEWAHTCVKTLTPTDVQVVANFLYLSHASSVLQVCLKNSATHLFGLMWHAKNLCFANEDPNSEISILEQAMPQLYALAHANALITASWESCQNYVDAIEEKYASEPVAQLLEQLRSHAASVVLYHTEKHTDDFVNTILTSRDSILACHNQLNNTAQALEYITTTHTTVNEVETLATSALLASKTNEICQSLHAVCNQLTQDFLSVQYVGQLTFSLYYTQLYIAMKNGKLPTACFKQMFDHEGLLNPTHQKEYLADPRTNQLNINGIKINMNTVQYQDTNAPRA